MKILFEDDDLLVVSKPPRIHSVAQAGGGHALAEELIARYPPLIHASRSPLDGGLVQRLDYDTSGLILVGKTRESWETLFSALQRGEIKKSYLILVSGRCTDATITTHLGNPNRGGKKVRIMAPGEKRALHAHSVFKCISYNEALDVSLVSASAPTARRHQIRAHASYHGTPLIGDTLYGATRSLESLGISDETLLGPRSFFLHASEISFSHPRLKTPCTFSDIPDLAQISHK